MSNSKESPVESLTQGSIPPVTPMKSVTLKVGELVQGESLIKHLAPLPAILEDQEATFAALSEPFEPEDVSWLPQSINYDAETAVAAAYADKRAYSDRMDAALGKQFWQVEFSEPVVTNYTKVTKIKYDFKKKNPDGSKVVLEPSQTLQGTKVLVVAKVGVYFGELGWIWKSSTGAADADDENVITTAEAQAFKRACSLWGPGKYFYSLPKYVCAYSKSARTWKQGHEPRIPDWAIPSKTKTCKETGCGTEIIGVEYKDKANNNQVNYISALEIINKSRETYGTELCAGCAKKRRKANSEAESRLQ